MFMVFLQLTVHRRYRRVSFLWR